MSTKIIFFDIDGTIKKRHTQILDAALLDHFQKLRDRGIKLCIATGRNLQQLTFLRQQFEFDAYAICNGQYCFNSNNEQIYDAHLSKQEANYLLDICKENKYDFLATTYEKGYTLHISSKMYDLFEEFQAPLPEVTTIDFLKKQNIIQVVLYEFQSDWEHIILDSDKYQLSYWHNGYVDFNQKNASKRCGIKAILDYFDLDVSNAMAFGDGDNDFDMLDFCQIGVAMGDASDKVKKVANYVCPTANDNGVIEALKYYNLI